jgi:hypothetical protein
MDSEAVAFSHLKVIERITEIQTTSRIYASPTNNICLKRAFTVWTTPFPRQPLFLLFLLLGLEVAGL